MSWHSPIGARCQLCPIGRAPNEKRTACEPCVGNEYSDGQGMLCEPYGIGLSRLPTVPSVSLVKRTTSRPSGHGYMPYWPFSVLTLGQQTLRRLFHLVPTRVSSVRSVAQGQRRARVACCAKLGSQPDTDGVCKSCVDTLEMPDPRQIKSVVPPVFARLAWWPPGVEACCPMPGVWIHVPADRPRSQYSRVAPCEADGACVDPTVVLCSPESRC